MSNLQPNARLKVDLKKMDFAQYPSWVARCDIKGSDGTMLNPIFWKKVQGQKHHGRWEIAERQIPSVKMLFKTNTKGTNILVLDYLSKSKTQLVIPQKKPTSGIQHMNHTLPKAVI